MSQIARVFVVVNLLLAAGFLYSAAMFLGLNNQWKEKHISLEAQRKNETAKLDSDLKAKTARVDELTRESQTLKEEKASLQASSASLKTANDAAELEKRNKDAQIAKESGNVASANENLKRAQDELAKRTEEANKLRADAQTAQGSERTANESLTKANDTIRERDNLIVELEKTKTTLGEKVAELEIVKDIAVKSGVSIENIALSAPIADAKVIGVDMEMKLVQVNAGTTQKVSRGSHLDIVRGGNYVGRIKIDQVFPNSSAGTISVLKPGETVQVGDRATNTLN